MNVQEIELSMCERALLEHYGMYLSGEDKIPVEMYRCMVASWANLRKKHSASGLVAAEAVLVKCGLIHYRHNNSLNYEVTDLGISVLKVKLIKNQVTIE